MNITLPNTPKDRKASSSSEKCKLLNVAGNTMLGNEEEFSVKTYTMEESFDKLWDKLEEHYGVDLRKL
jgi:hypothetical protein